jgi:hypothetical protein
LKRRSQVLRRCLLTLGTSIVVPFRYALGSCSADWAAVCGQPVLHDTTSTYATGAQPHSMPAVFVRLTPLLPLQMQLAFICIVYPSLVVTYIGQASYLSVSRSNACQRACHPVLAPALFAVTADKPRCCRRHSRKMSAKPTIRRCLAGEIPDD